MSGLIEVPCFQGAAVGTVGTMAIACGTLYGDLAAQVAKGDKLVVVLSGSVVVQVNVGCENLRPGDYSMIQKVSEHRGSAADPSLALIATG